MIKGDYEYSSQPEGLGHYVQEFHGHHYQAKKKDSPMLTIINDHNLTLVNMARRALQGVTYGLIIGVIGHFHRVADKRVITQRARFQPIYYYKRFRFHAVYGALAGLGWYFIHDTLLCPHGRGTFEKEAVAHAIGGAVLAATLYQPSSFFIGALGGVFVLLMKDYTRRKPFPTNFELQLVNFNPEQRERARRDEDELRLSRQLRAHKKSLQKQQYVL